MLSAVYDWLLLSPWPLAELLHVTYSSDLPESADSMVR
jgi:hypothetical protein